MEAVKDLQMQVVKATQDYGVGSVLFRNAIGRKLGLNVTDIACLNFLLIKGAATPTELAHYTGLTTGSATTMIDRLQKAHMITRTPNPHDRRGLLIEINQKTRETMLLPLVSGVQQSQRELLDSYSKAELQAIADFLTRFTQNITEHTARLDKK